MDSSYNNLGGFSPGGVMPQTPISSGTGDIILAPEKKSRKKLMITLIVVALIVGGIIVSFLLLSNNKNNVSNTTKLAFNRYANNLLFGDDSDKELGEEYDEAKTYEIDKYLLLDESDKNKFFTEASDLLSRFESSVENENQELKNEVIEYRNSFEVAKTIANWNEINLDELWSMVLNNDLDTVNRWIEKQYSVFTKSKNNAVVQFGNDEIDYYEDLSNYLEEAKAAGCIEEIGSLICESFSSEGEKESLVEKSTEIYERRIDAEKKIVSQCWDLRNRLYNGVEESKV